MISKCDGICNHAQPVSVFFCCDFFVTFCKLLINFFLEINVPVSAIVQSQTNFHDFKQFDIFLCNIHDCQIIVDSNEEKSCIVMGIKDTKLQGM